MWSRRYHHQALWQAPEVERRSWTARNTLEEIRKAPQENEEGVTRPKKVRFVNS